MSDLSSFEGEKYVNLVTYRKSGEAIGTPMWFIVKDGKMFMRTAADSGKVKRLRAQGKASLAVSTATGKETGPQVQATVRMLSDSDLEWINAGILKKYGLMKRLVDLINRFRVRNGLACFELSAA